MTTSISLEIKKKFVDNFKAFQINMYYLLAYQEIQKRLGPKQIEKVFDIFAKTV